jgi:uncharacterized protein (UPF0276 family)
MAAMDKVGLGWRAELSMAMLERLADLEVIEVIAEDWLNADKREAAALADLADNCPLLLHGVALGLAGSEPLQPRRLDRLAKLIDRVRPAAWSEHLAFVRAGGIEIGHLAAPPRNEASVAAALANIECARRVVGSLPCVENIATLVEPPAGTLDEAAWVSAIVRGAGAGLLLDLHNLYANALNFGRDPFALLRAMPLEQVRMVHLSGGRWIRSPRGGERLLDDHLHDVPDPVFDLLEETARRSPAGLTVIVERDGHYPEFDHLMAQVCRARDALARGRAAVERLAA